MIRSGNRGGRLAIAVAASLGLLWTTTSAAFGAPRPPAPGGTIYFYSVTVPQGQYAVAPSGGGPQAVGCAGDRTHGGAPRRVVRVEAVGGTFARIQYSGFVDEPIVRLVSTDESCGDVHVLWAPGPGYRLLLPMWSMDGRRVALDVQRYDASGQLIDQGLWVGDVNAAGDGLDALHLAMSQVPVRFEPQPASLPAGLVAYNDVVTGVNWAPDARRVVYAGDGPAGEPSGIYVVDLGAAGTTAPATARRVSISGSTGPLWPAFSPVPGDERIAYVEYTGTKTCTHNDIFTVSAAGGIPRRVTNSTNADVCGLGFVDWSPDGRWLAFKADPRSLSGDRIWYIAADGSTKAVSLFNTVGGPMYSQTRWRR